MDDMTIFNLQLLADGDGGGETAPGDTAAVAGQQALLALGVPADKLRKRAKNAPAAVPEGMFAATPAKATAAKPSWDELMADPDYNGKMQSIVRSRVKRAAMRSRRSVR